MKEIKSVISVIIAFLLFAFISISCNNSNQHHFEFDLQIDDLEPTSIYLEVLGINEVTLIDSTISDSLGNIHFSGNYDEPQLYRIRVQDKGQMFVIIDNDVLKINANANNLYKYSVEGSATSQELSKFMHQMYESNKALTPLQLEKNTLTQSGQIDSLDRAYLDKQIQIETDKLSAFIKTNAEQTSSIHLALFYANFLPLHEHGGYMKSFLAQLPARFDDEILIGKYKNEFYKHFNKSISEQPIANDQSLLDTQAPAFTMKDIEGTSISLANLKGDYVILIFGASWNANSKDAHKAIKQLYNAYNSKNVAVISIGVETDQIKWTAAVNQENLPWAQVSSCSGWDCATVMDYKIISLPTTLLINPEGKIIGIDLPDSTLNDILKANTTLRNNTTALTSL